MIDIGVNLTDVAFQNDLELCIEHAKQAGVTAMIVTGTDINHSHQAQALCQQFNCLYSTAGIHPHYADQWNPRTVDELHQLALHPCVVAIGETGLDFYRNLSTPAQQISAFEQQLELACQLQLPVFLHERDAFETQRTLLQRYRDRLAGGVQHCFTGDRTALFAYLDLGLYIGITGWICDERRGLELQSLVKHIPLDRLLIETDSPYLLPRDLRPRPATRRNEPRFLGHIAQRIAELTATDPTRIQHQTTANALQLFNLPPPEIP